VLIIGIETLGFRHPAEIIFDPHPSPLDLPSPPATPQPQGILLKTYSIDKLSIVSRHLDDQWEFIGACYFLCSWFNGRRGLGSKWSSMGFHEFHISSV
jgi:hypothetical protein